MTTPGKGGPDGAARTPPWPWAALLLYFALQLVARLLAADALELDEAEQVLWTQQLALGYGTQPPLYTWLQWSLFQLFGVSVFALSLLKNLLLAATMVFVWLAARTVLPGPWAVLSAATVLLLPQFAWEAQRDLTHSVLCTAAAAAMLWIVFELLRRPRPLHYLGLGVVFAVGTLGKYSFVLFAGALAGALLLSRDTRPLLASRWLAAGAALALLLLGPHLLWLVDHAGLSSQGTLAKMRGHTPLPWAAGVMQGTASLARALAGFVTPLWLVLALLMPWRKSAAPAVAPSPQRQRAAGVLGRYLLLLGLALGALVLAGASSTFKARWLLPLLFLLPLACFVAWPSFTTARRQRALTRVLVVPAIALPLLIGARPAFDARRDRPDELNLPARALVAALHEMGWHGGNVVANTSALGATLRLHQAGAPVRATGHSTMIATDAAAPTLWIATGSDVTRFEPWRGPQAPACVAPPRVIELPYRHARAGVAPLRWTVCITAPAEPGAARAGVRPEAGSSPARR